VLEHNISVFPALNTLINTEKSVKTGKKLYYNSFFYKGREAYVTCVFLYSSLINLNGVTQIYKKLITFEATFSVLLCFISQPSTVLPSLRMLEMG